MKSLRKECEPYQGNLRPHTHIYKQKVISARTPPSISIVAPTGKTYDTTDIQLTLTVSEITSWLGYSIDGQANVTFTGNVTLPKLSAGAHSLRVYAKDTVGNTGSSVMTNFSVAEPFPVMWLVAGIAIPVVAITTVVMLKKRSGHRQ